MLPHLGLNLLHGHCNSPIAGHARAFDDGCLALRAMVFTPGDATTLTASRTSDRLTPQAIGEAVAEALIRAGAREMIDAIAH
ncbi:hypothetical protein [Kitasatospora aureofaciens]|uniref:hypothetical protein n=1 Tax=Kitasatospora aureofaciens TaxID=1894 RepID=UPI001C4527DA|nr:hypothetical protein [Kitasatospora aureofaciens]MBV6696993.1 hypothetical protein [Kitasatospora aureofaciens]